MLARLQRPQPRPGGRRNRMSKPTAPTRPQTAWPAPPPDPSPVCPRTARTAPSATHTRLYDPPHLHRLPRGALPTRPNPLPRLPIRMGRSPRPPHARGRARQATAAPNLGLILIPTRRPTMTQTVPIQMLAAEWNTTVEALITELGPDRVLTDALEIRHVSVSDAEELLGRRRAAAARHRAADAERPAQAAQQFSAQQARLQAIQRHQAVL